MADKMHCIKMVKLNGFADFNEPGISFVDHG
jgi:hypothetical protein